MARTCVLCRRAPATQLRRVGLGGRHVCGGCAAALVAVRPIRPIRPPPPPPPPPKPACLPDRGRAHHWDIGPGMAAVGTCRYCGRTYAFAPAAEPGADELELAHAAPW